jgi:hypothetical protein
MKTTSTLIGATVWFLLTLGTVNQIHAIPITYTYTGSTYTQTTLPGVPGLTLFDRMTASITMDSALWGTEDADISSGVINSGPYSLFDSGRVTTDSAGAVLAWALSGSSPGKDVFTVGHADGSGRDIISGDTFILPPPFIHGSAWVDYLAGSRIPGKSWSMVGVPDACSSLSLLSLSLISLLCFWHSQRKQASKRRLAGNRGDQLAMDSAEMSF